MCTVLALPAVADEADARQWLERMSLALATRNYEGKFYHLSDSQSEAMRVIHRVVDGQVTERVVSLDGGGREIVRTDKEITCFLPDQRAVLVERRTDRRPLIAALPSYSKGLEPHYRIDTGAIGKVLGHKTQLVVVSPRDQYRYGYRIRDGELIGATRDRPAGRVFTGHSRIRERQDRGRSRIARDGRRGARFGVTETMGNPRRAIPAVPLTGACAFVVADLVPVQKRACPAAVEWYAIAEHVVLAIEGPLVAFGIGVRVATRAVRALACLRIVEPMGDPRGPVATFARKTDRSWRSTGRSRSVNPTSRRRPSARGLGAKSASISRSK
jgi:hypothetical protein